MLSMIAAAALALPAVTPEFEVSARNDVPRSVMKTDLAGVWYEAFVDPSGKIMSCEVIAAMGDADGAKKICKTLVGKQVTPARDSQGKATYGAFRSHVTLATNLGQLGETDIGADMAVQTDNLAAGASVRANIVVEVDGAGKVTSCEAANGVSTSYTRAACSAAKMVKLPLRSTSQGTVGYVYPLAVDLTDKGQVASR